MFLQAGMQKEIFHKLVSKLEQHCNNVLIGCEIDYRRIIAQRSVTQVRCLVLFLASSVLSMCRFCINSVLKSKGKRVVVQRTLI